MAKTKKKVKQRAYKRAVYELLAKKRKGIDIFAEED